MEIIPLSKEVLLRIHRFIHDKEKYKVGDKVEIVKGVFEEIYLRSNGCRAIDVNEYSWMEQNPNKSSQYAQEAKLGWKITWGVRSHGNWGLIRENQAGRLCHVFDGDKNYLDYV